MPLTKEELLAIEAKAHEHRRTIIDTPLWAGSGHIGGALSMIDVTTLLYSRFMRIDPDNADWEDRDRFILSKGHAGIGFVAILADIGYVDRKDLETFNLTGSNLGIHLDASKVPGVDASTGSLGHGLSIALGTALAAKQLGKEYRTFCLLGDGECQEGSVWEAAMAIAHFNPPNLVTLVDRNHAQIDGMTEDVMPLEPFADKWRAFGFHTVTVDGHDFEAMNDAIREALDRKDVPTCIILDTCKGKGIGFCEGNYRWHYGGITQEMGEEAMRDLDAYYERRVAAIEQRGEE
jgi:transketolase